MIIFWLKHSGTRFPIHRGRCKLGRSPHCFVVLPARRVSREHAEVWVKRGELLIRDLGSRNGTHVNGRQIHDAYTLREGDVIEIGDERLEVLQTQNADIPATLNGSDLDEEPAALVQRNVLELAEELLLKGAESGERATIAQTIRSMIDALVERMDRTGRRLSKGESVRLVAVAQVVARWLEDEATADWSDQVARTLSA